MRLRLLLLLGCMLMASGLIAQQSLLLNRNYRPSRTNTNEVVFMYYPYTSNVLDLLHFKSLYPEVMDLIPDEVTIIPPDLDLLEDTTFAVAYLPSVNGAPGMVVFMIVGNTETDYPLFFVDFDLDRNFGNDGDPMIFPKDEESKPLAFEQRYQGRIYTYRLNLLNPLNQKDVSPDKLVAPAPLVNQPRNPNSGKPIPISQLPVGRDERRRIYAQAAENSREYDRVAVKMLALMGFGTLSYSYFNPATSYPTEYTVDFNTKGLAILAQYRINKLKVGGYARYEHLFYWSSDKYTRLGEPYLSCYTGSNNQFVCNEIDNIRRDINLDLLPRNRFSYGLNLEYTFRLSRMLYLAPFVNLYAQRYTVNQYVSDRYYAEENTYLMDTQFGQEIGTMMVADVSGNISFLFSAALTNNGFRPSGFFDRNEVGGLRVSNRQGSFGLGTQIRL